jgi:hypothetical protein
MRDISTDFSEQNCVKDQNVTLFSVYFNLDLFVRCCHDKSNLYFTLKRNANINTIYFVSNS